MYYKLNSKMVISDNLVELSKQHWSKIIWLRVSSVYKVANQVYMRYTRLHLRTKNKSPRGQKELKI